MPQFFSPNNLAAARAAMLLNPTGWMAQKVASLFYPSQPGVISPRDAARDAAYGVPSGPIETYETLSGPMGSPMERVIVPTQPTPRMAMDVGAAQPNWFQRGLMAIGRGVSPEAIPNAANAVVDAGKSFFNRINPTATSQPEVVIVPDAPIPQFPVDHPDSPAIPARPESAIPAQAGFLQKLMSGMGKSGGGGGAAIQAVPSPIIQGRFFGNTPSDVQSAISNWGAPQGAAMASRAASQAGVLSEQARADASKQNADAQRSAAREALTSRETTAANELRQRAKEAEDNARLGQKELEIRAEEAKKRADNIPVAVAKIEAETKAMEADAKKRAADAVVVANRDFPNRLKAIADDYENATASRWFTNQPEAKRRADAIRSGDPKKIDELIASLPGDTAALKARNDINQAIKAYMGDNASVELVPGTFQFRLRAGSEPSTGASGIEWKGPPTSAFFPAAAQPAVAATNEVTRKTADGRIAVFDGTTKQFIRYAE